MVDGFLSEYEEVYSNVTLKTSSLYSPSRKATKTFDLKQTFVTQIFFN